MNFPSNAKVVTEAQLIAESLDLPLQHDAGLPIGVIQVIVDYGTAGVYVNISS